MNAYLNRFKLPSTLCKQADAEPAGSRVCTKSAQMQGARRRSNARSVRRVAQRRSWALFVQTLRGPMGFCISLLARRLKRCQARGALFLAERGELLHLAVERGKIAIVLREHFEK